MLLSGCCNCCHVVLLYCLCRLMLLSGCCNCCHVVLLYCLCRLMLLSGCCNCCHVVLLYCLCRLMLLSGCCSRCKKPLKPCVVVQIATEGNNGGVPRQIPVLAASGCGDNVLLAHGHFLKPTFENLVRSHMNWCSVLTRTCIRKKLTFV